MCEAIIVGKGPTFSAFEGKDFKVCALNGVANHFEMPQWIALNDVSALGEISLLSIAHTAYIICPEYLHADTGGKNLAHWRELLDRYRYKVYNFNLHTAPKPNTKLKSFGKISSVAESAVCVLNYRWNINHFILNGIGPEPGYHSAFNGMAQVDKTDDHFVWAFKQLKDRIEKLGCTYEMH